MTKLFITGGAGFIASTASEALLKKGYDIVAIDNFCDYYDPALKRKNVEEVQKTATEYRRSYTMVEGDIRDQELLERLFKEHRFDAVISWAANAGVRPSIKDPRYYIDVNVMGLTNILETMRQSDCKKLVFISSSSVYGNNPKTPFSESDNVDHPISPYAASKKAGELIAHTYHILYNLDIHCLRYFTVFGPRQRPDLAINKFTRLMLKNEAIPMFGDGSTARDYTYVDDTVRGTILSLEYLLNHDDVYDIINIGGFNPISLKEMIQAIADELQVQPIIEELPMQDGDVNITYSDNSHAEAVLGYRPEVSFKEGIHRFVQWYKKVHE